MPHDLSPAKDLYYAQLVLFLFTLCNPFVLNPGRIILTQTPNPPSTDSTPNIRLQEDPELNLNLGTPAPSIELPIPSFALPKSSVGEGLVLPLQLFAIPKLTFQLWCDV